MPVTKTCTTCGKFFDIPFEIPINLTCQSCGSVELNVTKNVTGKCLKCGKNINLKKNFKNIAVHSCEDTNQQTSTFIFSDKVILPDAVVLRESSTTVLAIPYYQGDQRVERATRTWIYPETVFILTDEGIIPPGSGVCKQLFISSTGKSSGICKKTIPYIRDIFANLLINFPGKEFYGFSNSDIILPPGKSISSLLPSNKKEISIHHRNDVSFNHDEPFIWKMKDLGQVVIGKDAFFVSERVCKIIVEEFTNMFIGAPAWDTLLACWLYKRFGGAMVEFCYGEIWHESHKSNIVTAAENDLSESKFNRKQMMTFLNSQNFSIGEIWQTICNDTAIARTKSIVKKKIGLIQPGRVGDIIICLPIAKYFFDHGYEVVWPVQPSFASIFERAPYVNVIQLDTDNNSYNAAKTFFEKEKNFEKIIDLGIGFGREQDSWNRSKLKFDEWKYAEAGVPIEEKYKLFIRREPEQELALAKDLGLDNFRSGYMVTHSTSSFAKWDFMIPDSVEIRQVDGYHLFDWLLIIENALQIYCVDSSICNLINQLDIGVGKRFIKTWHDIRPFNLANILTPQLGGGWRHYNPIKYKTNLYPEYINDNNAASHIIGYAKKYCIGEGLDLGGGANPFPGADNLEIKKGRNVLESLMEMEYGIYDFIFSSHFLEHVEKEEQQKIIDHAYQVLSPEGILFFYLPHKNMEYWSIKNPAMIGPYGHKVDLNPEEVKNMLLSSGFEIIDYTDTPDHYWSFIVVGQKKKRTPKKRIRK